MHFIWKLGNICRSDFHYLIEFYAKQIFEGKILKSDPKFMAKGYLGYLSSTFLYVLALFFFFG